MTLPRTIAVVAGVLAVMVTVVILRAETTRYEHEVSQLDGRAEILIDEIREQQLELTRLRNPALIRARVGELRLRGGPPESKELSPRAKKP